MRHKSGIQRSGSEKRIRTIKRKTRRQYSFEEKICTVFNGLSGEDSIAESMYYKWSKDFMEAGKKRLSGDILHEAATDEVQGLRHEARDLRDCVADLSLENRLLKEA